MKVPVRSFFDALFRRSKLERRMEAEMRFHLESLRDDLIRRGLPPREAGRRARMEFGSVAAHKEECRQARGLRLAEEIAQNLRYGFRSLRKSPGFTAVVIATLALGIGANTAIFSVLEAVILKPLPYPDPGRLVMIREQDPQGREFSVTWPDFADWRDQNRSFAGISAFTGAALELTGIPQPVILGAAEVSASYFSLLGVKPEIGRTFTMSDDKPGAERVVVLSDALWRGTFGADPAVLGKNVRLSGELYQVIGVAEPYFSPDGWMLDAYLPIGTRAADPSFNNRAAHGSMSVLARLAPGVPLSKAQADLDAIMASIARRFPRTNAGHRASLRSLEERSSERLRPIFAVLLAAVGLVLLIACVNVANLLLARAADRRREFAVRASLGAAPARILRQIMTESFLLAMTGGVTGIALAAATLRPLVHFAPRGIPRLDQVHIDIGVLVFSTAISIATGVLFGLAPALQASWTAVNEALKDGGRSSAGRGRRRMRSGLLVAEVTFASLLLVVSMLLIRSLGAALASDPGFQPDHLIALRVMLLDARYKEPSAVWQFLTEARLAIRSTPGIVSAGSAACPPLAKDCGDYWYEIPGRTHFTPGNADDSLYNTVDAGYFPAIGATLLEGRNFEDSDTAGSPRVAIIDETLARKWWPHESAVDSQIKYGGPGDKAPLCTIVGVIRDVNREGLDSPREPEIFFASSQQPSRRIVFLVRSTLEASPAAAAAERAIHSVDKDLPVRTASVTETMAESLATRKFLTFLLATFGALALTLAGVGIFGVTAYQAAGQTHEIGIRKALGARTSDIIALFSGQALVLVFAGVVLGIIGALAFSRLLAQLLFGVKPWDPVTLLAAPFLIGSLGLLASYLPARRAARLDPIAALRQD